MITIYDKPSHIYIYIYIYIYIVVICIYIYIYTRMCIQSMITIIFGHCMTVSAILRKDSRRIVRKSDRNSGRACSMQNVAHCYFNIEITKTESLQDSVDSFDIEMAIRKILQIPSGGWRWGRRAFVVCLD